MSSQQMVAGILQGRVYLRLILATVICCEDVDVLGNLGFLRYVQQRSEQILQAEGLLKRSQVALILGPQVFYFISFFTKRK